MRRAGRASAAEPRQAQIYAMAPSGRWSGDAAAVYSLARHATQDAGDRRVVWTVPTSLVLRGIVLARLATFSMPPHPKPLLAAMWPPRWQALLQPGCRVPSRFRGQGNRAARARSYPWASFYEVWAD